MGELTSEDCERLAEEVRIRAGLAPLDVEATPRTAVRLLGRHGLRIIPRLGTSAALVRVEERHFIVMRANVRDPNFVVAHELGHWALAVIAKYDGPDEESLADKIGAALVAPRPAVRAAIRWYGDDASALARTFFSTQSLATLRAAEVEGFERALVAPKSDHPVRIVTQGAFPWASSDEVRRWAAERRPRGMRKTTLRSSYDHGRTVLTA